MSGDMSTQLDRAYARQSATRAAAIRFLERTGNDDLLAPLGLVIESGPVRRTAGNCSISGNKLPSHGVCRRSNACRTAANEPDAEAVSTS